VFKSLFILLLTTIFIVTAMVSAKSQAADTDPTRPFGYGGSSSAEILKPGDGFTLSSIIHGDGIHTAVINGKIYKMFDYVGEYRITAINSHSVILRSESERLKINIFNNKGFESHVVESTVGN
jgi:MSHA biogenesis protein MshK